MPSYPLDSGSGRGLSVGEGGSTEVRDAAVAASRSVPPARLLRAGGSALPWLLTLAVATAVLLQAATPAADIARYATYWCLGVTLPGLLVVRAAVGTRGNWPEDLALGAVTGLGLELACFALWSVLGLQQQLWVWPVIVMASFVAVPRLRRYWLISSPKPLPVSWSWGVASAIVACTLMVRQAAFVAPLPPAGGFYDQDVVWHLSIVHELTRSFPPQVPQVAGELLRYHWFSHMHMAAAHLVSGAPVATVVLRLWILPLLAVTALIGARLAMELSKKWWSGPLAAWCVIVFTGTSLLPLSGEAGVIFPTSPSQVYLLPFVLGIIILIVRALRGVGLGAAGWAVLVLLLVAAAGAKPSGLPLVLAGVLVAGFRLLILRRSQWRAALSVAAIVAVILPVSILAVAGSDSGSTLRLFNFVEWIPIYHSLTGAGFHPAFGPALPEGVSSFSTRSLVILAILLLVPLVQNVGRLVPFAWLGSQRLRKDPAAWFIAGFVLAGWVVYLILAHPSYSQAYFLRLADPVASVFGVWALVAAVPVTAKSARRVVAVLAGGTLLGAGVVALARALTPSLLATTNELKAVVASVGTPLAVVGVAVAVALVAWVLARRKLPGLRGWGSALALAALVLGGPAEGATHGFDRDQISLVAKPLPHGVPKPPSPEGFKIGSSAAAAMAWIDQHAANNAVVATNRHCVIGRERPACPAIAFWVSGLGGRRTVLEGWGYTSAAKWVSAPTPFPARMAVNDAVFTHPSLTTIERLRQRYGVSWLVADKSAGPVASELARFAVARFSSGKVTVYELP